jgi:hypothetical protein
MKVNYTRAARNIYFYVKANGKRTYRARKFEDGKMLSKTFTSLRGAKEWLKTVTMTRGTV